MQTVKKQQTDLNFKKSKFLQPFIFLLITLLPIQGFSQFIEKENKEKYPYVLPIWGDKVQEKGMEMPLPIGFSVNYVTSTMGMGISDLNVSFNAQDPNLKNNEGQPIGYIFDDLPQESINAIVDTTIMALLNNNVTTAEAHGLNYRLDVFLLPFLNVYGMIADMKGSTAIGLGPTSSTVDFTALAYGGGVTLAYGTQNGWFGSVDMNYSASKTELIDELIPVSNYSMRIGKRFKMNQGKQKLAIYLGAMNRNFSNDNASPGSLSLEELLGSLQPENTNTGIAEGIPNWMKEKLKKEIEKRIENNKQKSENTVISYAIKKDLLQTWTVQCGFSFELNKHFAIRGEYGIAEHNKFLMTGINYRFGF